MMRDLLPSTTFALEEVVVRLGLATLAGLVLGIDPEMRNKSAGLRTHAMVALSSAVITVSALDLYGDVRAHGGQSDPLRVIQGLAQAIGFIVAGMIFVARGSVQNLTTAANVWIAASLGIAYGAGQVVLAGVATAFTLVILIVLRFTTRGFGRARHADSDSE